MPLSCQLHTMTTVPEETNPLDYDHPPLQGVLAVAARCPQGHSCVVTTYPLRQEARTFAPFPTFYWLTCPQLNRKLADLERRGCIAEIEHELANDPTLQERLRSAHQNYITARWNALTPDDQQHIMGAGLYHTFHTRGIGGMANHLTAVKCLHLHVAHHLAAYNPVGEYVLRHYNIEPCHVKLSPS